MKSNPLLSLSGLGQSIWLDYIDRQILQDGTLQGLIEKDSIVKFQRSDGWVYPGIDPVRRFAHRTYQGPERRMIDMFY